MSRLCTVTGLYNNYFACTVLYFDDSDGDSLIWRSIARKSPPQFEYLHTLEGGSEFDHLFLEKLVHVHVLVEYQVAATDSLRFRGSTEWNIQRHLRSKISQRVYAICNKYTKGYKIGIRLDQHKVNMLRVN